MQSVFSVCTIITGLWPSVTEAAAVTINAAFLKVSLRERKFVVVCKTIKHPKWIDEGESVGNYMGFMTLFTVSVRIKYS